MGEKKKRKKERSLRMALKDDSSFYQHCYTT
jgi:hypothetical protein